MSWTSSPYDTATTSSDTPGRRLLHLLDGVPRTRLAHAPTPLLPTPALAKHAGSRAGIWIKADHWTGFGLGGNKVRKVEYELGPSRLEGVTHLITAGGPHSNHCRVTAAAASYLGLGCTLVINGEPDDPGLGNAALHRLLGAEIHTAPDRGDRGPAMEAEAARIAAEGGRALIVPLGASTPRGALGYARATAELYDQWESPAPPDLYLATSSGGTLAGIILGIALLDWSPRVVAVSADDDATEIFERAVHLATDASTLLGDDAPDAKALDRACRLIQVRDDFVGAGYGAPTPASRAASDAFGRTAGTLLDPFYTAKAGGAMLELMDPDTPTVFLHTGGHPAILR